jgi:hypothetical protein
VIPEIDIWRAANLMLKPLWREGARWKAKRAPMSWQPPTIKTA